MMHEIAFLRAFVVVGWWTTFHFSNDGLSEGLVPKITLNTFYIARAGAYVSVYLAVRPNRFHLLS